MKWKYLEFIILLDKDLNLYGYDQLYLNAMFSNQLYTFYIMLPPSLKLTFKAFSGHCDHVRAVVSQFSYAV